MISVINPENYQWWRKVLNVLLEKRVFPNAPLGPVTVATGDDDDWFRLGEDLLVVRDADEI